ncbi:hypothetical protein [Kitasatospora sp. NPDC059827]|uniref:hypothetical protein n=1 Tax=Kitasatospora sp. NPDC059827 TaxID=3346964 RepID=UPI00366998B5
MKKFLAALAVAGTAATSVIVLAPAASAAGCVPNSITSQGTTLNNVTVLTKSNSPCHDVNVSWSNNPWGKYSGYAGYYRKSSGSGWIGASRGYVQLDNGTHDINDPANTLITDLSPGTQFTVISRNPGDQLVVVH